MAIFFDKKSKRMKSKTQKGVMDVCVGFYPTHIYQSLADEKIQSTVKIAALFHQNIKYFDIEMMSIANPLELRKRFFECGIFYDKFYQTQIESYLVNEMQNLQSNGQVTYYTRKLGWQKLDYDNCMHFILGDLNISNNYHIQYSDTKLQFTNGTFAGQMQFLRDEIFPFENTRLAFVLGLSSIIASYIEPVKSIGTLVVNISGESSTGKSTIAELSASMFADPQTSNYGIVRTFNATSNFIFGMSEGRYGLPIILDDANANGDEHNKSKMIYQFALGESRGRCNADGSTQNHHDGWSGLVLITSEAPLLENINSTKGALVRTLNIDNLVWTNDAQHSERIKTGVRANFGFFGQLLADYISSLGIEKMLELHKYYEEMISKEMTIKDSLSSRMASKLAPIAMCGQLINEYLNQEIIYVDDLVHKLVMYEQSNIDKRDVAQLAYDKFESFVNVNYSNFIVENEKILNGEPFTDVQYNRGKTFGLIRNLGSERYVYIDSSVFDNFLKDEKFENRVAIMKKWYQRGLILRNNDSRFVFKALVSFQSKHYRIKLNSWNFNQTEDLEQD